MDLFYPQLSICEISLFVSMSVRSANPNIEVRLGKRSGLCLPSGCKWEPRVVNGKKEGSATVYTEEGMLYAEVVFSEDKLDGVCSFYEEGALKEKIRYKKDVMNGWSGGDELLLCGWGEAEEGGERGRAVESGGCGE